VEAIELEGALELVGAALTQTPRVLILGQHYLGRNSAENPFFAAVHAALTGDKDPYGWWFDETKAVNERAKVLSAVEDAVIVREQAMHLLGLRWTAVFTSAIDSTTRRLLQVPGGREVHQIFRPASGRANPGSIPLFRLFGSVDRSASEELPPANGENELRRRRRMASSMLDYLSEIVAAGNAFIEGWWAGFDWLRPRDLSQALVAFGKGQVFLFSTDDQVLTELERDEDLVELVESGVVTLLRPSLIDIVARLKETGRLRVHDERRDTDTQVFYPVVKKRPIKRTVPSPEEINTAVFPQLEWRRLSSGKEIPTDLDPTKPLPDSSTARSEAFRSFAGGEIRWEWLNHLAFHRPVFAELVDECCKVFETPNPEEHTIVVYGQSGSGKSVLLCLLALELRRMGLPVVFSGPSILPVSREHIEAFCEAISSVSSAPIFFINDGTRDDSEYFELSSYLASRARSCVVVGSSYPSQRVHAPRRRGSGSSSPTLHSLLLPVKLSIAEGEAMLSHLAPFIGDGKNVENTLSRFLGQDISNFFAITYRLLPESRLRGRIGIVSEFTESSRKLQERLDKLASEPGKPDVTALGFALQQALGDYLVNRIEETTEQGTRGQTSEDASEARRLINAVMVVSQLGLQVPQSLALRLIGHNIPAYRNSVDGDILDVFEDREGVSMLQARHALEASIWVSERLGSLDEQFALVQQLAKQLSGSEISDDYSIELEFVVQVLRALGPQGQLRFRRPQLYMKIADLVAELRDLYGSVHPRLLLIEANAIREAVKNERLARSKSISLDERRKILNEWIDRLKSAEKGLQSAQEIVLKPVGGSLSQSSRRMLSTLATERAGVIGFMIGSLRRALPPEVRQKPEWAKQADQWLEDARASWREALTYEDESPAIDTACWIFAERHELGGLGIQKEAEIFADWSEAIDRYDEYDDLSPAQSDIRDQREGEFARRMGDIKRFGAVAERAAGRGSNAIHTLNARWLENDKSAAFARTYLEDNCDAAKFLTASPHINPETDRTVLLLYCRLWWQSETGFDRYFPEERICLKFSRQHWEQLLHLCRARLSLEGEREHSAMLFLSACALFHLGSVEDGERVFDHLDRLGAGGIRRSRAVMLLADAKGNPRQLTAEFQGRRRGERFLAWCDDLRTNVPFNPLEFFGPGEIRTGQHIGPFHLSFRFRGPYAEPLRRLTWHRKVSERGS